MILRTKTFSESSVVTVPPTQLTHSNGHGCSLKTIIGHSKGKIGQMMKSLLIQILQTLSPFT